MPLTLDQLKALDFGYLTGQNLLRYCSFQLLASQYNTDDDVFDDSIATACSEAIDNLNTKYDIGTELAKRGDARCATFVKLISIMAIRDILGDIQGLSKKMEMNFAWAQQTMLDIRNGQMNLPLNQTSTAQISGAHLVCQRFKTLG